MEKFSIRKTPCSGKVSPVFQITKLLSFIPFVLFFSKTVRYVFYGLYAAEKYQNIKNFSVLVFYLSK